MGLLISKQYNDSNDAKVNRLDIRIASSNSKVEELKKVPVKTMAQRDLELEHSIRPTTPWYRQIPNLITINVSSRIATATY